MSTLLTDSNLDRRKLFLSLATKRAKAGSGSSTLFLNQRSWTLCWVVPMKRKSNGLKLLLKRICHLL